MAHLFMNKVCLTGVLFWNDNVRAIYLLICLSLSVLAGCKHSTNQSAVQEMEQQMANKTSETVKIELEKPSALEANWQIGTVQFLNLEGGFYGIVTKDGKKLLPLNLQKNYQQVGAVIKFTGKAEPELRTIQQWGTPFRIKDVEIITAGRKQPATDL